MDDMRELLNIILSVIPTASVKNNGHTEYICNHRLMSGLLRKCLVNKIIASNTSNDWPNNNQAYVDIDATVSELLMILGIAQTKFS